MRTKRIVNVFLIDDDFESAKVEKNVNGELRKMTLLYVQLERYRMKKADPEYESAFE